MSVKFSHFAFIAAAITLLLSLPACESTPPIQEMSDARQAIAVARGAGAASKAASELTAAEQSLERAEQRLQERDYDQARREAVLAHSRARAALMLTERSPAP